MSDSFPISFDVYSGDQKVASHSVRNDQEKEAILESLRRVYGEVVVANEIRPEHLGSMYRGKEPFTREQIVFAADCILVGALDMIESGLPDSIEWADREGPMSKAGSDPTTMAAYERGALEAAGEALSILYAQLTGDGMGCYDALCVADHFDEAVGNMMAAAWKDKGEAVKAAIRQRHGRYQIKDVIPHYPDTRHCAEAFADVVLDELRQAPGDHDGFVEAIHASRYAADTSHFVTEVMAVYGNERATEDELKRLLATHRRDHDGLETVLDEFISIGLGLRENQ